MTYSTVAKYRRSTSYKITFPTLPSLTTQPGEVDLYQEHGSHDVLHLKFIRVSKLWQKYLETGTPVLFSWKQGKNSGSWIGYVTHVKSQDAAQERRELTVVCSSATYLLKERATRTWTNKTVPDVARIIAKEFGFTLVTEPSKRKFEQLSIAGESYWEWLREHGNKIGYGLTFNGTELIFKPFDKLLDESTFNSSTLSTGDKLTSANVKALDRTLDLFELDKTDFNESSHNLFARKNISGVNPFTGKTINKIADPSSPKDSTRSKMPKTFFNEFSTDVVHSDPFAKSTAEDSAANSGFSFPAKARGQGDPRIAPLKAVNIVGTGLESDGFWIVEKAHHSFNITGLYEIDLSLKTDGIGSSVSSPFRKSAIDFNNTINVEQKILNDSKRNPSRSGSTRLVSKSGSFAELNQGFDSSNTRWRGQ